MPIYIFIFTMVHFKVHYWFGEVRRRRGDILLLCELEDFHCNSDTGEQHALHFTDSVGCQSGHE